MDTLRRVVCLAAAALQMPIAFWKSAVSAGVGAHLDTVPQDACHSCFVSVENNARGVQQLDMLVQVDLLDGFGHACKTERHGAVSAL
eukprot:scaffold83308_cov20-Prasinocladus_malaysianus.AAC.1